MHARVGQSWLVREEPLDVASDDRVPGIVENGGRQEAQKNSDKIAKKCMLAGRIGRRRRGESSVKGAK